MCGLLAACSGSTHDTPARPLAFGPGDAMLASQAWVAAGSFCSVAFDAQRHEVVALETAGRLARFDLQGRPTAPALALPPSARDGYLRLANLAGDAQPEALTFQESERVVDAVSFGGEPLWSFRVPDEVEDVAVCDLDGDGRDEAIVGCASGVIALDHDGAIRWHNADIREVSRLSAAHSSAGGCEVYVAASRPAIQVLDPEGKAVGELAVGPTYLLRAAASHGGLAIAEVTPPMAFVAVARDGRTLWRHPVTEPGASWNDGAFSGDGRWFAACSIAPDQRLVVVLDTASGARLLTLSGPHCSGVAWADAGDGSPPRLLTASRQGLTLWLLRPRDAGEVGQVGEAGSVSPR